MNIFILDLNHQKCAEYHCDKHVVKMILESAQILSTVVRKLTGLDVGYKATHEKHPCTLWAMESYENFVWLYKLAEALNNEWRYRYGHDRDHKSWQVIKSLPMPKSSMLPKKGLTPFAQAMPEEYRDKDAVKAYRAYYRGAKAGIATWKNREEPEWFKSGKVAQLAGAFGSYPEG